MISKIFRACGLPLGPNIRIRLLGDLAVTAKVLGENQCVPVLEAIRSVTTHAAFQSFSENHKGSLEVGKLADMAVLNANPLKIDPIKIKNIEVLATVVGGKVVYGEI